MLRHFRCRRVNGAYERPSIYCLRNAIVKVAPEELDAALRAWFSAHGHDDASLAIDGKTMKGAVDEAGRQVHILGACGHETAIAWGQKKTVLTGDDGSDKRTNEIGVAIPLLDQLGDLAGKTVTADALLTQTAIASYLRKHDAHYMFVAKDNQKTLLNDIRLWFHDDAKRPPDFAHTTGKPINGKLPTAHGRWEQREIWTTAVLNDDLLFPGVGQAFLSPHPLPSANWPGHRHLGRHLLGRDQPHPAHRRCPKAAAHQPRHWTIENSLHRILDDSDNWNEDNSRIRTGHGPENMTGLRRFAIGVIKMHGKPVAATVRKLHRTPRLLLDYLKMSANTRPKPAIA